MNHTASKNKLEFGYNMAWIAVKSTDPAGVAQFLKLENVCHELYRYGIEAIHNQRRGDRYIYITPAHNGWVLIVGHALPFPLGTAFSDKCTPLIASLSQEFGESQYFLCYPELDFFGWARAVNVHLQRAFISGVEESIWNHGRLTIEELALGLN